jgi:hypothetical protein
MHCQHEGNSGNLADAVVLQPCLARATPASIIYFVRKKMKLIKPLSGVLLSCLQISCAESGVLRSVLFAVGTQHISSFAYG